MIQIPIETLIRRTPRKRLKYSRASTGISPDGRYLLAHFVFSPDDQYAVVSLYDLHECRTVATRSVGVNFHSANVRIQFRNHPQPAFYIHGVHVGDGVLRNGSVTRNGGVIPMPGHPLYHEFFDKSSHYSVPVWPFMPFLAGVSVDDDNWLFVDHGWHVLNKDGKFTRTVMFQEVLQTRPNEIMKEIVASGKDVVAVSNYGRLFRGWKLYSPADWWQWVQIGKWMPPESVPQSVAAGPGTLLVMWSSIRTSPQICDPAEGHWRWGPKGKGLPTAMAVSPCGRHFAIAHTRFGDVTTYDRTTFAPIRTMNWGLGQIDHLAYSQDGTTIRAAGRGGITIWDND